jgi:DNA-directed RNA polymerase specialized sigma24 family protein
VAPAAARLAELYVRHARSATQVAYLLTGDRAAAEDLVQDAFVRISSRLGHLRKEDVFATYLRKTVVILCRSI